MENLYCNRAINRSIDAIFYLLLSLFNTKIGILEKPRFTLTGHSNWVRQVMFLPDGRLVSCSSDGTIKIWNAENGKELCQLNGHHQAVLSIALLPNGCLVSGSIDKTIKIWDLEKQKAIRTISGHSDWVVSMRVLKNGKMASYSKDDTIKIWNLNSKKDEPVLTLKGHGNNDFAIQMFAVLSNRNLVTCSLHKDKEEECILRVWSSNPNETSPIQTAATGLNDARSLAVLSNDQVALGFKCGAIKLIDPNNKLESRTKDGAHRGDVTSLVQISSNGILISAGWDDPLWNIKVWKLLDWNLLQIINTGHSDRIRSLSIAADERFLASGSDDKTIKLWSIGTELTQQQCKTEINSD